jgi:hypothetical protein
VSFAPGPRARKVSRNFNDDDDDDDEKMRITILLCVRKFLTFDCHFCA